MVFVEFIIAKGIRQGKKKYFVGMDLDAVLADTNNGQNFGYTTFGSHQVVTQDEVHSLGFVSFDDGVRSIEEGSTSYMLGVIP